MADVAKRQEEQYKRFLRQQMGPGDHLIQDGQGQWTIVKPESERPRGFTERVVSGLASQWYGLDDKGEVSFGERPGLVDETLSLGSIPSMAANILHDLTAQKLGIDPEDPYMKFYKEHGPFAGLYQAPDFAVESEQRASDLKGKVREKMGLDAPKGLSENFAESLGTMLGQLPLPGGGAKQGMSKVDDLVRAGAESPLEWFTPTVRPSLENYTSGALAGGALGTMAEEPEEEYGEGGKVKDIRRLLLRNKLRREGPRPMRLWAVGPDGKRKFMGQAYTNDAAREAKADWEEDGDWPKGHKGVLEDRDEGDIDEFNSGGTVDAINIAKSMKAKYASGGKVSALKAIKEAIAHLDNGDTASALRALRSSPAATTDPKIKSMLSRLRDPRAAKEARRELDRDIEKDSSARVEATFAKGGKVDSVRKNWEKFLKAGNPLSADALIPWPKKDRVTKKEAREADEAHLPVVPHKYKFAEGGKVSAVANLVKKARTRLADAKKVVASHGNTLVKEDGEYIVKKKGERTRIEGDDSHYFTDDIDDAVGTSALLAKQRSQIK